MESGEPAEPEAGVGVNARGGVRPRVGEDPERVGEEKDADAGDDPRDQHCSGPRALRHVLRQAEDAAAHHGEKQRWNWNAGTTGDCERDWRHCYDGDVHKDTDSRDDKRRKRDRGKREACAERANDGVCDLLCAARLDERTGKNAGR